MSFEGTAAKPFGGKLTQALTGADELSPSWFGGTEQKYNETRNQYGGLGTSLGQGGQANIASGADMLGRAAPQAVADRQMGVGMSNTGMGVGRQGFTTQGNALTAARGLAGQNTDSLAQMQLQQGLGQMQRGMMTQAASARGGNQAAALRNAQAAGAQMGLQTNQQAAMMRAQEQQARLARMIGAEQMAAQVGGQQMGLGYGLAGQGVNAAQQSTGQLGNFGAQQGNLGLGQTNAALGAYGLRNQMDAAQLEADRAYNSAMVAGSSPLVVANAVTNGISAYYGMGKGGGG